MLCEQIYGKLSETDTAGKTVEYVDMEWHEAFKKIHRKTTDKGREIGIRMDDSVLSRGLLQDDVIYVDDELVIANRHAPLFWGDTYDTFTAVYDEPMLAMLSKLHGVKTARAVKKLDFGRRISASVSHHHSHGV